MLYLFQFSSLSLLIWQSLLWKLDLISCFIFSDWSFILLSGNFVRILLWTVVCFVSHCVLLFPQIEIGFKIIIYKSLLNYIRYIDIYWKYWNVLIYIAVYWCIFLSIKLIWVVIVGIDHIILPTFILWVFSCQSVYVWFILYLFVWGCIIILIVLLHVLYCLAMKV